MFYVGSDFITQEDANPPSDTNGGSSDLAMASSYSQLLYGRDWDATPFLGSGIRHGTGKMKDTVPTIDYYGFLWIPEIDYYNETTHQTTWVNPSESIVEIDYKFSGSCTEMTLHIYELRWWVDGTLEDTLPNFDLFAANYRERRNVWTRGEACSFSPVYLLGAPPADCDPTVPRDEEIIVTVTKGWRFFPTLSAPGEAPVAEVCS